MHLAIYALSPVTMIGAFEFWGSIVRGKCSGWPGLRAGAGNTDFSGGQKAPPRGLPERLGPDMVEL
jgi:hypothetical protein